MIGLFFGDTDLPKQILKKIKQKKIKYFIIDLSKNKIFKKNTHSQSISIGQFGKIFEILKKKDATRFYLQVELINLNFYL